MKTRLILVRHAEAEGNIKRLFHGWTNSSITEKGHLQARSVAERLKYEKIDVLYSSSLRRTLQTAQYISDIKKLPIIHTEKLREINGGDWENVAWAELAERWAYEYHTWENEPHIHQMPNGESIAEFQERLVKEIMQIVNRHRGKSICVVTHGTAIKALLCYFYRKPLEEFININWHENTAVSIVEIEKENGEDNCKVVYEGDISHLGEELSTISNQDWWLRLQEKTENNYKKEN